MNEFYELSDEAYEQMDSLVNTNGFEINIKAIMKYFSDKGFHEDAVREFLKEKLIETTYSK